MNDLCTRCQRRERYAKLLICSACAEELVERRSETPFVPAWLERARKQRHGLAKALESA